MLNSGQEFNWEGETSTPHRSWMKTVREKIMAKVTNAEKLSITEKKLYQTVRKRKNWSAPGIDGIQNFWWKKLKGVYGRHLYEVLVNGSNNLREYQSGLCMEGQR